MGNIYETNIFSSMNDKQLFEYIMINNKYCKKCNKLPIIKEVIFICQGCRNFIHEKCGLLNFAHGFNFYLIPQCCEHFRNICCNYNGKK